MTDWRSVKDGDLKAPELRQEKINTHAVVIRALGGVGAALMQHHPNEWRTKLVRVREIDWRKSVGTKVNPTWDNVCITAGSVVSNRQARAQTLAVLKELIGVQSAMTREEKKIQKAARAR